MKKLTPLLSFLFIGLLSWSCNSEQAQQQLLSRIPDPKTLQESYVSNPDSLLNAETVAELNGKLSALDQAGTAHIDVVFVQSIGELVPKEAAHELFNNWKIGSKTTNNGLLILIVKDQKRIEFETGYGLEGPLPDVTCYRIQQEYMIPYAKAGNFDKAVRLGVDAVISTLRSGTLNAMPDTAATPGPEVTAQPEAIALGSSETVVASPSESEQSSGIVQEEHSNEPGDAISLVLAGLYFILVIVTATLLSKKWGWRLLLILALFVIPVIATVYLNAKYPITHFNIRAALVGYFFLLAYAHIHILLLSLFSAAAFKTGDQHEQYLKRRDTFASMEWLSKIFALPFLWLFWKKHLATLEKLRYENISCEQCGKPMTLMAEDKDDALLSKGQAKEEEIQSVDYDVWRCDSCPTQRILDYSNLKSGARKCGTCGFMTAVFSRRETIQRATTSSEGYGRDYYRCANCGKETSEQFIIAKIATSSSSSSSGSSSSSSGSSSSSSGGSSGGGGAGSSW